jgi:hypothetical protein
MNGLATILRKTDSNISKISAGVHTFLINTQKCMWKKSISMELHVLPLYQCNIIQKLSY